MKVAPPSHLYRGWSTASRLAGRIRQLRTSGKLIESFGYHGWTVLLEVHLSESGSTAVAELMFDGAVRCRMTRAMQLSCDVAVAVGYVEARARDYIDRAVGSLPIDGTCKTGVMEEPSQSPARSAPSAADKREPAEAGQGSPTSMAAAVMNYGGPPASAQLNLEC